MDEQNCHETSQNASADLEQSYEILSNSCPAATDMETANQLDGSTSTSNEDNAPPKSNPAHSDDDKTEKELTPQTNSPKNGRRKSIGFFSIIQSSSSTNNYETLDNQASNLPTSLANAFSSLTSSISSNFNLGSSSNGSTNNRKATTHNNSLTIDTVSMSTEVSCNVETREQILNKKATYERKNLINLTKLIVKDLISSSLSYGRTIDECYSTVHLNNYFTLIDKILKHGLKQNLLSNKSSNLWTALDNLPKYLTDKRLTSETVRSLAHTKSPDGRIRAWSRIAMMQKKLPEYFNELLANKDVLLKDIYHKYAFMMNDEAHVFAGLIIGVNVIDCNFFVKDDNFDSMDDVIDLSPYLKPANSLEDEFIDTVVNDADTSNQLENITAILDQKNYLEERGKHLESTVLSLRNKIKQLEEQNSRLEIDAKVNEVRIERLQKGESANDKSSSLVAGFPIPDALKNFVNSSSEVKKDSSPQSSPPLDIESSKYIHPDTVQSNSESSQKKFNDEVEKNSFKSSSADDKLSIVSNESEQIKDSSQQVINESISADLVKFQKLSSDQEKELSTLRERVKILETSYRGALERIRVLERDLDIQVSMNKDKEMTISIYEKDLREKQNQVESLRDSLAGFKKSNSDLNERLNDTSFKLKERLTSVTTLQTSLDKWKIENKTLASRLQEKHADWKHANSELKKALDTIEELKKYNEKINDDLRKERECGQSCSNTVETQTNKISELTTRLNVLEEELEELRPNKDKLEELTQKCKDYEQSLEEVGNQLRESRLEVESLKENSSVFLDSQWLDSKQVKNCALCQLSFSVTRRKHHCRLCGNVFCGICSDNKMELASSSKPTRVCDTCHAFLLAKFVKSSSSQASTKSIISNSTTS